MKLRHRKIHNQCSIFLACLVLATGSVFGFVRCDAEDGHLSIELVSRYCCGTLNTSISSEESKTPRKETFSSSKDNCGPCVDTPISAEVTEVLKETNFTNFTISAMPVIAHSTDRNYDFSGYQLDSELFASISPCIASLRTIVLLT